MSDWHVVSGLVINAVHIDGCLTTAAGAVPITFYSSCQQNSAVTCTKKEGPHFIEALISAISV
jgi:hypothetical protein